MPREHREDSSERAGGVHGVGLLAADHERQHALRRVFADPEAEPASVRGADEVRAFDAERIEDRDGIPNAKSQRVRVGRVRLVAPPDTAVVGVDRAELGGQCPQRPGDVRTPDEVDRIHYPPVEDDWRSVAPVVLEVDLDAVLRVPGVRHRPPTRRSAARAFRTASPGRRDTA